MRTATMRLPVGAMFAAGIGLGALLLVTASGCGPSCGKCDPKTERCSSTHGCVSCHDVAEPNDTKTGAYGLTDDGDVFTDDPDSRELFTRFALDGPSDEDWYSFRVRDDCCGANPNVSVSLEELPLGHQYELAIWLTCNRGTARHDCLNGTRDETNGRGCIAASASPGVTLVSRCEGFLNADDGGIVHVRVRAKQWGVDQCGSYDLRVVVH